MAHVHYGFLCQPAYYWDSCKVPPSTWGKSSLSCLSTVVFGICSTILAFGKTMRAMPSTRCRISSFTNSFRLSGWLFWVPSCLVLPLTYLKYSTCPGAYSLSQIFRLGCPFMISGIRWSWWLGSARGRRHGWTRGGEGYCTCYIGELHW